MPHPNDRSQRAAPTRRGTAAASLRTITDAGRPDERPTRLSSYAAGSREASALPTPPLPLGLGHDCGELFPTIGPLNIDRSVDQAVRPARAAGRASALSG